MLLSFNAFNIYVLRCANTLLFVTTTILFLVQGLPSRGQLISQNIDLITSSKKVTLFKYRASISINTLGSVKMRYSTSTADFYGMVTAVF